MKCLSAGVAVAVLLAASASASLHPRRLQGEKKSSETADSGDVLKRTAHVDTRIGTGGAGYGIGQVNPGPQVPFAAMRLGPDSSLGLEPFNINFDHMGGYHYEDDFIQCFSHTHLDGAGEGDFQNFGVTMVREVSNDVVMWDRYRSQYKKETEVAVPGYYAVTLADANTRAELTVAGTHAGIHRYTCHQNSTAGANNKECTLLIDVCHSFWSKGLFTPNGGCKQAQISNITFAADGSATVSAWVYNHGRIDGIGFPIYFQAVIVAYGKDSGATFSFHQHDRPMCWENQKLFGNGLSNCPINGTPTTSRSLGVLLTADPTFGSGAEDIVFEVRAALSFINHSNTNFFFKSQLKMPGTETWLTFDQARASTEQVWEDMLGVVSVNTGDAGNSSNPALKAMYSALYRAHLAPTIYTENGQFLGEKNKLHTVPDASTEFMSDLSIWDIYRSQQPLLQLLNPKAAKNTVWSMMNMYNETGVLPKWVLYNKETGVMVGKHSAIVMSDAVRKGVKGMDNDVIYAAVVNGITAQNKQHMSAQMPHPHVAWHGQYGGGSKTLDYAADAGAVLALAKMRNDTATIEAFTPYAHSYKNIWVSTSTAKAIGKPQDAEVFCPRYANGTFDCPQFAWAPYPFSPQLNHDDPYTEGNALEYRWFVPHDLQGLVSLFDSKDDYAQKLNDFFALAKLWPLGNLLPNPFFWAGNEPDILAPAQFPAAGNQYSWLSDKWFSKTLHKYYWTNPGGLPGNDDYGTMSAFALFGYTGIYPIASTNDYVLVTPQFPEVTFSIPADSKPFTPFHVDPSDHNATVPIFKIKCHNHPGAAALRRRQKHNDGDAGLYVANATINGVALSSRVITHDMLVAGGSSSVTMIELFLSTEPTVFGQPSPAAGGPAPFMPSADDEVLSRMGITQQHLDAVAAKVTKAEQEKMRKKFQRPK